MRSKILAVIPARLFSKRFPRKVLHKIKGKTILEHLYREVSRSKMITKVIVATDSDEVIEAVSKFGGQAVKTSKRHRTGSDRAYEVAQNNICEIIVNIQADNLGLKAGDLDKILKEMKNDHTIKYATFAKKIENEDELYDPNRVKLIFDSENNSLWFSRYPIPFLQGENGNRVAKFNYYYHVGIYFYRKLALKKFANSPRTELEKAESLEQLRILENGDKIRIFKIKRKILSIDSPDDAKKSEKYFL